MEFRGGMLKSEKKQVKFQWDITGGFMVGGGAGITEFNEKLDGFYGIQAHWRRAETENRVLFVQKNGI